MNKLNYYDGHHYPSPSWHNHTLPSNTTDLLSQLLKHVPESEIVETEEVYTVRILAPESDKSNFHVEVKDGQLIVTHKVKKQTAFSKNFEKKFLLQGHVFRLGSARASYKEGILTVEIPKIKPKEISVE